MNTKLPLLFACALIAASACSSDDAGPASSRVRLTVSGVGSLSAAPTTLRLRLYGEAGWLLSRRLPALDDAGRALVYSPLREGTLRLLLRAEGASGDTIGEGVTQVLLKPDGEVAASIALEPGARADGDGDGVPDAIDNCPEIKNPDQGSCADGGIADGSPADSGIADGATGDVTADIEGDLGDGSPDSGADED